jgi:low affinity Fe/Cu permease
MNKFKEFFRKFAEVCSLVMGSSAAFVAILIVIVGWLIAGPLLGYSSGWQLFINSISSVLTLLVVFLVQNSQNRDTKTVHLKLDQLLTCTNHPDSNNFISLENCSDLEIEYIAEQIERLHREARLSKKARKSLAPIN